MHRLPKRHLGPALALIALAFLFPRRRSASLFAAWHLLRRRQSVTLYASSSADGQIWRCAYARQRRGTGNR
jgi:hypothetical protein